MAAIYCPHCKLFAGEASLYDQSEDFLYFRCLAGHEFVSPKFKGKKNMYVIIRDPNSVKENNPAKIYHSLEAATEAIKSMARSNPGQKYYIAKLTKSAITEPDVKVEDC